MKPTNFPVKLDKRRAEALERQTSYDTVPAKDKLARLDRMFGVGLGAKKERAKLIKALEKACEVKK